MLDTNMIVEALNEYGVKPLRLGWYSEKSGIATIKKALTALAKCTHKPTKKLASRPVLERVYAVVVESNKEEYTGKILLIASDSYKIGCLMIEFNGFEHSVEPGVIYQLGLGFEKYPITSVDDIFYKAAIPDCNVPDYHKFVARPSDYVEAPVLIGFTSSQLVDCINLTSCGSDYVHAYTTSVFSNPSGVTFVGEYAYAYLMQRKVS